MDINGVKVTFEEVMEANRRLAKIMDKVPNSERMLEEVLKIRQEKAK